ncbi:hypothetical protein, partial [Pseudomonas sp. NFACC02]|uniref:hypothetical protein n=1 Tax=Pseudomonas sp. NFACC02 TaxID=1566250 RepID=UPI001C485239
GSNPAPATKHQKRLLERVAFFVRAGFSDRTSTLHTTETFPAHDGDLPVVACRDKSLVRRSLERTDMTNVVILSLPSIKG